MAHYTETNRIPTSDELWDMYENGEFDNPDTDMEDNEW